MKTYGYLDVYMNKKTLDFCILNYSVDEKYGYYTASGDLIEIPRQKMESEGLGLILDYLRAFEDRKPAEATGPFARCATDSARKKFFREHKSAAIQLVDGGKTITINPLKRSGGIGGYEGVFPPTELNISIANKSFFAALIQALEKAE